MLTECPLCGSGKADLHLKLKDYFLTKENFEILRCKRCGLLYTWPHPTGDSVGKYYKSDDYLSHNENRKGLIPFFYNIVKQLNMAGKLRMATNRTQGRRLLDFGCGTGDFLRFAQQRDYLVTGADIFPEVCNLASKKLGKQVVNPDDVFNLPDSSFDIITMWHVLEHICNLKLLAGQMERLLAVGGRLVVALPNYQSYDARYYKDKWAAYDVPRHLNHFNLQSLKAVFAATSLQFVDVMPLKWDAYYISILSEGYAGHRNAFVKGILNGFKSNCSARKSGQYSSCVYIFEKKLNLCSVFRF